MPKGYDSVTKTRHAYLKRESRQIKQARTHCTLRGIVTDGGQKLLFQEMYSSLQITWKSNRKAGSNEWESTRRATTSTGLHINTTGPKNVTILAYFQVCC